MTAMEYLTPHQLRNLRAAERRVPRPPQATSVAASHDRLARQLDPDRKET